MSLLLMDVEGGPLRLVERAVSEAGVGVLSVETDVRVAASVSAAARAGLSRFGRIDIICNNAGVVGPWLPIWEQRIADWKWLHEVNLMGVINGISAFVPAMVERNSGHVVNTASINALSPLSIGGNRRTRQARPRCWLSAKRCVLTWIAMPLRSALPSCVPGR